MLDCAYMPIHTAKANYNMDTDAPLLFIRVCLFRKLAGFWVKALFLKLLWVPKGLWTWYIFSEPVWACVCLFLFWSIHSLTCFSLSRSLALHKKRRSEWHAQWPGCIHHGHFSRTAPATCSDMAKEEILGEKNNEKK